MPRRKNTQIRVYVVEFGREKLMLRIKHPDGRVEHETTDETDRAQAERVAARREDELRKKANEPPPAPVIARKTWVQFRSDVVDQLIKPLAKKTQQKYATVFNAFEKHSKPPVEFLDEVTTEKVSQFLAAWRDSGATEATLFGSLGHFQAALRWAVEMGWIARAPVIRKPTLGDEEPTKGRAITDAELKTILDHVHLVVKDKAEQWKHALNGLNLSGLRLDEAINLSWDIPGSIRVDLTGEFPMLQIPRKRQKKRKSELWPITPDFAEFLLATPKDARTGWVFQFPMPIKDSRNLRRMDSISKVICEIGEAAKIVVDEERGKFASAHDFRRSFGVRWSLKCQPGDLQLLMRHADIETTMKFYTRQKSDVIAARIWQLGNLSGNSKPVAKNREASQPHDSQ